MSNNSVIFVLLFTLSAALAAAGLTGCNTSPPRLLQLFHQLDVVRDGETGMQHEELSIFVMVEDDDGRKDIDELILTHPEAELQWKLAAFQWREIERNGEVWIGGSGFRMPGRPEGSKRPGSESGGSGSEVFLPRGRYVVELFDRGGERAEMEFILPEDIRGLRDGPVREDLFPDLHGVYETGNLRIHGAGADQVSVFLLSDTGEVVKSETLPAGPVSPRSVEEWKRAGAVSLRLHRYLDDRGIGLVNGVFRLP